MFEFFEMIGRKIGLGKSPLRSMTVWGLALYQASNALAGVLCGENQLLPPDYCWYANAGIAGLGEILVVLGIRRHLNK